MELMSMSKNDMLNMNKTNILNGMLVEVDSVMFVFDGGSWVQVQDRAYDDKIRNQEIKELRIKKLNRILED